MPQYGGFWVRFVAYIIDAVLLYVGNIVVSLLFGLTVGGPQFGFGGAVTSTMTAREATASIVLFVLNVLYFALMESSARQGTVGKIAMGLVVTDLDGERISFLRAIGRYFAKIISALILLFGFFMVGWTQRKQGLHDMIAGTLVYKARSPDLVRNRAAVFE